MSNLGLKLYLLFMISWFLHLGSRVPFFGLIRFDFLLLAVLAVLAFLTAIGQNQVGNRTEYLLRTLILYSILTIPFVEWPGSVLWDGIPNLVKALAFYYFTICFIKTEKDLKLLIFTFVACQSWRILEPFYLHITEGYWGSTAWMADQTFLDRLAGGPFDVINPNGLAFVICTTIPFLYFLRELSWKIWIAYASLTPIFIYALMLTGSRSGMIGIFIIFLGILVRSKRRILLGLSVMLVAILGFPFLSSDMQDRYLSIIGKGEKNAATAVGREEGVYSDLVVALRRPIFGHGLGTSLEANSHFGGAYLRSHNLYTEIAQELGLIGLVIFILFMKSIFSNFDQAKKILNQQHTIGGFLPKAVDAMQVWLMMNFIFSFASYGLSGYVWYFFAGLSIVVQRFATINLTSEANKLSNEKQAVSTAGRRVFSK